MLKTWMLSKKFWVNWYCNIFAMKKMERGPAIVVHRQCRSLRGWNHMGGPGFVSGPTWTHRAHLPASIVPASWKAWAKRSQDNETLSEVPFFLSFPLSFFLYLSLINERKIGNNKYAKMSCPRAVDPLGDEKNRDVFSLFLCKNASWLCRWPSK